MLEKGFTATTVDEICEKAGLTKGSFFHYFESKEDLAKATLLYFFRSMNELTQNGPFQKKTDPLQRLLGYIDFMVEMSKDPHVPKSCLLGNFAQELSDTHPEIRTLCSECFSQWANTFKRDLDAAKAKYAPRAKLDTQSLADHWIAIAEGSLLLAKAKQDPTFIEKNLLHFKRYLQSVFRKKRKAHH